MKTVVMMNIMKTGDNEDSGDDEKFCFTCLGLVPLYVFVTKGAIQVLRNADGGGGCQIFWKKRYEGVRFNVISITRGWVRVRFQTLRNI